LATVHRIDVRPLCRFRFLTVPQFDQLLQSIDVEVLVNRHLQ
jgi:hypothetical protein